MKKIGKKSYFVCIFLLLLILSGCGFKDIDKRIFVVSIGIDTASHSQKKYNISLKFVIPGSKDEPDDFLIVSEKANSISEAVRMIKTKVDKEIDFGHAKVILFGQDLLLKKLPIEINYWFARRRDIQQIAWVGVGKPSALDVLQVRPKSEQLPSDALFLALGKDGSETPYIIPPFYYDYKKRLTEKGLDPMLPIIEAKDSLFTINTMALMNKKKMKTILTPEETKFLNFMLNKEEKSVLKVNKGKDMIIIETQKVKTKYKIITPPGKQPYIRVKLKVRGRIEEAIKAVHNDKLTNYENESEKMLNKGMEKLLIKMQKEGVDPIGFGMRYRSRHFNTNDWEEWQHLYPNIKFKVHSNVQIEDTGLIE
ncbi:spore gernimation protein GerC [Heyndrickxia sporothermodurans]|nr:spore gernimation protein GerC [Heyndrickxia sporothermodurans]